MSVNLDSKRQVRTKALATPREWQRLAKAAVKIAEESRRYGDYTTCNRFLELSRALDPAYP